ncbi:hypothetical protein VNO80_29380 [Phaseolus coccineus]|uniref:Uncharacterized protein n=1 Tax=Phaseolus coccineus TaxID=3886 RepID=A0AAN9LAS2_PHACN
MVLLLNSPCLVLFKAFDLFFVFPDKSMGFLVSGLVLDLLDFSLHVVYNVAFVVKHAMTSELLLQGSFDVFFSEKINLHDLVFTAAYHSNHSGSGA